MALDPDRSRSRRQGVGPRTGDGAAAEELRLELVADVVASSIVRKRLHRWLDELGWMRNDRQDVVLAVHEAVANAIDHAYLDAAPGRIRVTARMTFLAGRTRARLVATVRDWGRWRPAPVDPGYRGHGLTVMRGCMHSVEVSGADHGTQVRMVSPVAVLSSPLVQDPPLATDVHVGVPRLPPRSRQHVASEAAALHRRYVAAVQRSEWLVQQSRALLAAAEAACRRTVVPEGWTPARAAGGGTARHG
jgi:anti-sigma regulatory factor (Ser/Thr protein kinase)